MTIAALGKLVYQAAAGSYANAAQNVLQTREEQAGVLACTCHTRLLARMAACTCTLHCSKQLHMHYVEPGIDTR